MYHLSYGIAKADGYLGLKMVVCTEVGGLKFLTVAGQRGAILRGDHPLVPA